MVDNGSGISEDDVHMAFERHATSKIRHADDLESIMTMGFRGEALASIAAVSKVELSTRSKNSNKGVSIEIMGGTVLNVKPAGTPIGTVITVRELFFNTPARYKFLKKDSTEASNVADIIGRIALGYPNISFKLINNGQTILQTPGNGDLKSVIFSVYGAETAKNIIEVSFLDEKLTISGFVGKAQIARSNRRFQSFYINRRYVKSKTITSALDAAYSTFLMKNKYAFSVLYININPAMVDVNVHPSKMEVKFSSEQDIYTAVYHGVSSALLAQSSIRTLPGYEKIENITYNFYDKPQKEPFFSQQGFDSSAKEELKNFDSADSGDREESHEASEYRRNNDALSKNEDQNLFPSLKHGTRIVGQAFSTYILLERGEELFMIDQHAAHERIRYEALKQAYKDNTPIHQTLLGVIHIELTAGDYQFAISEADYFEKLGFSYESFGNNSIILRTAPYGGREDINIKEMFLEILDFVMNERSDKRSTVTDKALFMMACKSAVKANRKMNEREIESLLDSLAALDNPYTCPHGRPAIFKIRKYDLEKMFKRIV